MKEALPPIWLESHISKDQMMEFEEILKRLEDVTSKRVEVITAPCSSAVHHVPLIISLILLSIILSLNWVDYVMTMFDRGWVWLAVTAVAILVLTAALSRLSGIQRLLTAEDDMDRQVEQQALFMSKGAADIFLFVSLMEHRVVLLASQAVCDQLSDTKLQELMDFCLAQIQIKGLGEGLKQGLLRLGDVLGETFPAVSSPGRH